MNLGDFALPAGLRWTDEYPWTGRQRSIERSLSGAVLVQSSAVDVGRTITLSGDTAWITRAGLETLQALAGADATQLLTLHDGRSVAVVFNEPPFTSDDDP